MDRPPLPMGFLTPDRGLIFRITHIDNLPWILDHGLYCRNSSMADPNHVDIGNPELIAKRTMRVVPVAPGGNLADYVPFYYTPCSPMLLNIRTGHGGVTKRSADEVIVMVSSLARVEEAGVRFLVTDRHAYLEAAQFSDRREDIANLDWLSLQRKDFRRSTEDLAKMEKYQAEALIHQHLPVAVLSHLVCHGAGQTAKLRDEVERRGINIETTCEPEWFFP